MRYLQGAERTVAEQYIADAAQLAREYAKCYRSKCGSVIVNKGTVVGRGYNSPPRDHTIESCLKDALPTDFRSDKTCCIHAEQRALFDALEQGNDLFGSRLYFIRLDEQGNPKPSGEPYCTMCSKLALDAYVAEFVLVHPEGIAVYDTQEYNEVSFGRLPSLRENK
jgi:deoxycytidylate deaminase